MQLPGGSTRIPPARAPASVLDIINGNNIATITGCKRINNKSSRSSGPGYNNHRSKNKKHDSSGYRSDNESTLSKKTRHPETKANGRHRVTEQQLQSLASAPRRKEKRRVPTSSSSSAAAAEKAEEEAEEEEAAAAEETENEEKEEKKIEKETAKPKEVERGGRWQTKWGVLARRNAEKEAAVVGESKRLHSAEGEAVR
ncbi:hypothetical protein EAG_16213 [Camponotus floridanus]|uniref:Uncharacterized protein n=1 Tax=Camponotus floridanus TaxID=104421 RepID=E2AG41_CAMFO|nr:hypothetical protein EAG_16213 [Camponotus floridanus]